MQSDVDDVLKRIQNWSVDDLKRLQHDLDSLIQQQGNAESLLRHKAREFRGIGHGLWDEVGGVDEFLRQERVSWDEYEQHLEEGHNPR